MGLGYHERELQELVQRFKYGSETHLTAWLAAAFPALPSPFCEADALVPVPLHPLRLAERGYNQSALLARALGRRFGKRVLFDAVERCVATRVQASLSAEERAKNVASSFRVQPPLSARSWKRWPRERPSSERLLEGRRLLVVDDVVTTGSTSEAVRGALEQAGAVVLGVLAISVARPKAR